MKECKINVHRNLVRIQKKIENFENENNGDANATKQGRKRGTTRLAECELPKFSCREFTMPQKVYELLSAVETMKNPTWETYVAELEKRKGNRKKASIEVPVLGTDKKTAPPDPRSLQYRLKMVGEEIGISGLTYQIIRDTFAMLSLNAGGDVYSVACVMGVGVNVICDRYKPWLMKDDGFMKGIG